MGKTDEKVSHSRAAKPCSTETTFLALGNPGHEADSGELLHHLLEVVHRPLQIEAVEGRSDLGDLEAVERNDAGREHPDAEGEVRRHHGVVPVLHDGDDVFVLESVREGLSEAGREVVELPDVRDPGAHQRCNVSGGQPVSPAVVGLGVQKRYHPKSLDHNGVGFAPQRAVVEAQRPVREVAEESYGVPVDGGVPSCDLQAGDTLQGVEHFNLLLLQVHQALFPELHRAGQVGARNDAAVETDVVKEGHGVDNGVEVGSDDVVPHVPAHLAVVAGEQEVQVQHGGHVGGRHSPVFEEEAANDVVNLVGDVRGVDGGVSQREHQRFPSIDNDFEVPFESWIWVVPQQNREGAGKVEQV
ncbi:aspartate aminotransferase family protein [Babesia caballi]|uniref:Aspartate aminotransferase family protein n=1 Tax=Babesia caballi TaxID=5871 RepID=A0AAV4LU87_BABCB|nr:aspartate aminotransferase family protein [Babesia caballi]